MPNPMGRFIWIMAACMINGTSYAVCYQLGGPVVTNQNNTKYCYVCKTKSSSAALDTHCDNNGIKTEIETETFTCDSETWCCNGNNSLPFKQLSCSACASDGTWTDISGENYQSQKYGGTCNENSCTSYGTCSSRSTRYRCKGGYYGTVNGSTAPTCTQCPQADGIYTDSDRTIKARGTSTAGSNGTVGTCTLPAGTYYDSTGTFEVAAGTCPAS
ncbi:MAG: hypothetical protein LBF28_02875 [Rickettsiales bacterium]|nr:hypothetical protein [Rickettsiales bacterium]